MKKLIFLKQEWLETKGLKKTEISNAQEDLFQEYIKLFKEQMKSLLITKSFKIIKETPPNSLLIEYLDEIDNQMWIALRAAKIVDVVDCMI
jgi:uncharacterized protein YnzC (UPF0291/DUF896 family)